MSEFGSRGCALCYSGEIHEHTVPAIPEQPGMLRELALVRRITMLEERQEALALENRQWREKLPDIEDLRALRDEARMPNTVVPIQETLVRAGQSASISFRNYTNYVLRWIALSGDDEKILRVVAFWLGADNVLPCAPTSEAGMHLPEFCQTVWRCKWNILPMLDVTIMVQNVSRIIDSRVWGCAAGRTVKE